jgi:hypothetical protein
MGTETMVLVKGGFRTISCSDTNYGFPQFFSPLLETEIYKNRRNTEGIEIYVRNLSRDPISSDHQNRMEYPIMYIQGPLRLL